jgi:hypothetical protein
VYDRIARVPLQEENSSNDELNWDEFFLERAVLMKWEMQDILDSHNQRI